MTKAKSASTKKAEKKDTIIPNGVSASPIETSVAVETAPTSFASQPASEPKKTEISKASQRALTIPVTVQEEIRQRAYELYAQRGYSTGNPTEDWLVAEREVLQRYNHHSA